MLDNTSPEFLIGVVILILGLGFEIRKHFFQECLSCGGRLRLDQHKDHMGWNVGKKVSISFYSGPRKETEVWKCRECGEEESRTYWNWNGRKVSSQRGVMPALHAEPYAQNIPMVGT